MRKAYTQEFTAAHGAGPRHLSVARNVQETITGLRGGALITLTLLLGACGGGGGGGGGGGTTPPPPPASVTYTVQLTDIALTDQRSGDAVDPTGVPVSGATATRNP